MTSTQPLRRRSIAARSVGALCLVATTVGVSVAAKPAGAVEALRPNRGQHGVEFPTVEGAHRRSPQHAGAASGSGQLTYHGGVNGVGVTTGAPQVYLVFWGAGWGTQGASGLDVTLSGDPKGVAPLLQQFFRGLGTNNELWSGVLTQYCEGVAVGTSICPSNSAHVGYPTGGALAGVWVDPSTTAVTSAGSTPTSPVDHDLGAEAVLAAAHFGNTTALSNRNAQYVILSPTGTHPGGFNAPLQWCAWHDFTGDSTLIGGAAASSYGDIAFTNMPYVTDVGGSCGAGYVNGAAGALDGVTIVEGHEYAETVTDQNPGGGWWDAAGYENGDKCAWIGTGGTSGAQNIALSTGTFAVQSTYSNDGSTCSVSHAIVTAAANDFSVSASPTSVKVTVGSSGQTTISTAVVVGAPGTVTLTASGVPSGTSAAFASNPIAAGTSTSLTLSPTTTAPGTYNVTVTATASGVSHTASVSFVVASVVVVGGLTNGGFESNLTGWSRSGTTSSVSNPVHGGTRAALAGSTNSRTNGDSTFTQTFVATGTTLSFWYRTRCVETVSVDWATATLRDNTTSTTSTVLPKTCTNTSTWVQVTATVVAGRSYTLTLSSHDNNSRTSNRNTYTYFDDVTA